MIFLASDHAGFELKQSIARYLEKEGIAYTDMGPLDYDSQDDYPDFIIPAAEQVAAHPKDSMAIVLGGSGQGEAIAANKIPGIRAALFYGGSMEIVRLSKVHNNANVLSLGARFVTEVEALEAVKIWLDTTFSEEPRHARRLEKIVAYEKSR